MCQATVEASLGRVPGVITYTVTLQGDTARVVYDATQATPEQIAAATTAAGYKPREVLPEDSK